MLIACHRSSLLILDCISSITPSTGETTSLLGDDSEDELLPCFAKLKRQQDTTKLMKDVSLHTHTHPNSVLLNQLSHIIYLW